MMLINGQPGETLSALDRAVHYGDGLFETLAVRNGAPQLWSRHMARLAEGCRRLKLPAPDADLLWREAQRVMGDEQAAVLKIILTRGSGGRGYRPPAEATPTRLVIGYPWVDYPARYAADGVRVRLCDTRLGANPLLAGIKHLNRLEQVLARAEWSDENIAEGLMRDMQDNVIEGTMTNVFAVMPDGALLTPDVSQCGVAGVMRGLLLELSGAHRIGNVTLAQLVTAREVFLCNSLIGIWPVCEIADVATYETGPITRGLMTALANVDQ